MPKFACSVLAVRDDGNSNRIHHTCFLVEASSKFEADGLALAIGRKFYPVGDSWYGHHAVTIAESEPPATLAGSRIGGAC